MALTLCTNIKDISGIGDSRARVLSKLGITTVGELLYHFPRAYQYRGNVKTLVSAQDGETSSFILKIAAPPTISRTKNNISLIKFIAYDDTAKCTLTFFNQNYLRSSYKTGSVYRAYGKIVKFGKQFEIVNPVMEVCDGSVNLLPFHPVYPATEGMSTTQIFHLIKTVMSAGDKFIEENLPDDVIKDHGLMSRCDALKYIHSPESFTVLNEAKRRIIFEELYLFAQSVYERKDSSRHGISPDMTGCDMTDFKNALKFELTDAQKRTLNDIYKDMTSQKRIPMRRLVSGDVGSGKTICAAGAAYISAKSGYQTALLVPTEILARQHFSDLYNFFTPLGINVAILIGDMVKSEKERAYEAIRTGNAQIIVGTHALLTDHVEFSRLGLVICDEQHRFGVAQRESLLSQGDGVNMLVMSATPIPRTLAMVMFGDLDVSVIDTMPPGRKEVSTYVVDEDYRARINEFMRKEIAAGHQIYVVCPAVEERTAEELPLEALESPETVKEYISKTSSEKKTAVEYAEHLQKDVFPNHTIGCVHGKMKGADKARIMKSFEEGKTDILVSTTVIEVGVNIPNATMIVIENAESFGLSQLHQLRGRVGRSNKKSYCILVSSSSSKTATSRIEIMKETSSGFVVAEHDLKMRGPGDFIKTRSGAIRQHGQIKLSLADSLDDVKLLYSAFESAKAHRQI